MNRTARNLLPYVFRYRLDRVLVWVVKNFTANHRVLVMHGLDEYGLDYLQYFTIFKYLAAHLPGRITYTYDDGLGSNLHCIPSPRSILFINTDNINKLGYLSSHEIRQLAERFIIGSHGHTHTDLTQSPDPHGELLKSRCILEDITGQKIHHYAFPYGEYDQRTINIAEQYYDYLYIVKRHTDIQTALPWKHVIDRVCVSNTTTAESNIIRILLSFFFPKI